MTTPCEFFILTPPDFSQGSDNVPLDETVLFAPGGGISGLTISGVTFSGSTVTVTVSSSTGLAVGQRMDISGVQGMQRVNGTVQITAVGAGTFQFTSVGVSGAYTSGGTVNQNSTAVPHSSCLGMAITERDMLAVNSGVVLAPNLTNVTPNHCNAGSPDLNITLSGHGFTPSAIARFDGAALTTTYISSTALSAVIPASMLTVAGGYSVDVADAAGPSNALPFAVQSASGDVGYYAF